MEPMIDLMYHDDSCGELLDNTGMCPKCKFHQHRLPGDPDGRLPEPQAGRPDVSHLPSGAQVSYFQWKCGFREHVMNRLEAIDDSSPERCFGYIGRAIIFVAFWAVLLHLIWIQSPMNR